MGLSKMDTKRHFSKAQMFWMMIMPFLINLLSFFFTYIVSSFGYKMKYQSLNNSVCYKNLFKQIYKCFLELSPHISFISA